MENQSAKGNKQGNDGLGAGDFEDAIKSYGRAMQELATVGNAEDDRNRAERACLALHLNMAQANLKLHKFDDAKKECNSALSIDQKSIKALYRRGVAQAALARQATLFQEDEAKAGCAYFEALLKLDPSEKQAEKELQRLRAELKAHSRDDDGKEIVGAKKRA